MSRLEYTLEEKITRIKMDRNTKYLVVEGNDDIPKYENAIRSMTHELDFEPIAFGCKKNVLKLLDDDSTNFVAIVDHDFDEFAVPNDERLIQLDCYSIENYIFDSQVMRALISCLTKTAQAIVANWFNLEEWKNHVYLKLKSFIKVLHFYQTKITTNRKEWNSADLTEHGKWLISEHKISTLSNFLFDDNIPTEELNLHDYVVAPDPDKLVRDFPGKLLIKSLYLFLKEKLLDQFGNVRQLTANINNFNCFGIFTSTFITQNASFRTLISQVIMKFS